MMRCTFGTQIFRRCNGKPELAGTANIDFNLSHTDGAAVLAVTRNRPVGVDVERVRDCMEALELAERFFSAAEADWLRSQAAAHRSESFLACWTAKEASIKACGAGLSMPLATFSLITYDRGKELELQISGDPEHSKSWSIWCLDLDPTLVCTWLYRERGLLCAAGSMRGQRQQSSEAFPASGQ